MAHARAWRRGRGRACANCAKAGGISTSQGRKPGSGLSAAPHVATFKEGLPVLGQREAACAPRPQKAGSFFQKRTGTGVARGAAAACLGGQEHVANFRGEIKGDLRKGQARLVLPRSRVERLPAGARGSSSGPLGRGQVAAPAGARCGDAPGGSVQGLAWLPHSRRGGSGWMRAQERRAGEGPPRALQTTVAARPEG